MGVTLKPLHLLGSVYYAKRSLFSCKEEFSLNRIVESEDQTSKQPDAMVEEIAKDDPNTISYLPACDEWQKSLCQLLGMIFVRRNITHILQPIKFSISYQPAATVRIRGDDNCFFRALAFVITGSQDEHQELRAITTYATQCWNFIMHATLMLMKQWMDI